MIEQATTADSFAAAIALCEVLSVGVRGYCRCPQSSAQNRLWLQSIIELLREVHCGFASIVDSLLLQLDTAIEVSTDVVPEL